VVVHWLDIGMVMCLNLDRHELIFLFAKITFGRKVKS